MTKVVLIVVDPPVRRNNLGSRRTDPVLDRIPHLSSPHTPRDGSPSAHPVFTVRPLPHPPRSTGLNSLPDKVLAELGHRLSLRLQPPVETVHLHEKLFHQPFTSHWTHPPRWTPGRPRQEQTEPCAHPQTNPGNRRTR